MRRELLPAFGAGAISAFLSMGFLTGAGIAVLFGYFAPMPILFIGLAYGFRTATVAMLVAMFFVVLMTGIVQMAVFAATVALPSWLIVRHVVSYRELRDGAKQWYDLGEILARISALGGLFLIVGGLAFGNNDGGLAGTITDFLTRLFETRFQATGPVDQTQIINRIVPLFPGFMIVSWILMLVLNGVLTQAFLAKSGKAIRPPPDYSGITAPEWLYWAIVAAAVLALATDSSVEYVARNLTVILATPFFFIGLAIIHLIVKRLSLPGMALTAFYIFLAIVTVAAVVVAGLGFVEQWTGIRRRYRNAAAAAAKEDDEDDFV